ncbi:hemin uptake protein HemP [Lacticaseibacillus rhamnosus]
MASRRHLDAEEVVDYRRFQRSGGEEQPAVIRAAIAVAGGRRELIIQHGTGSYRLRITASNKLILTK